MNTKTGTVLTRSVTACAAAAVLLISPATAASINYGDFPIGGTNISFLDVTESSSTDAVPLFGPPTSFFIGLDFDPANFNSSASNGSADITDGQLNFMVEALPNDSIPGITVSEQGEYTLGGIGTPLTTVGSGASVRIEVEGIDHVMLATPFSFFLNDSVQFFLPGDAGISQPWQVSVTADLDGELASRGINFNFGATKISVVIDNTLFAISEQDTIATIHKTDFDLVIVPEPASAILAGLVLCAAATLGRRRSSFAW